MIQRLALAQALLAEPELLVLDEPLEGLDLSGRVLLHEIIAQQRGAGKTVLVVSHALGEVAQVCDRLAVLVRGRIAYFRFACFSTARSGYGRPSGRSPQPWDRSIDPNAAKPPRLWDCFQTNAK